MSKDKKVPEETKDEIAREYFLTNESFNEVAALHDMDHFAIRRFYNRWVKKIYSSFIKGVNQDTLESSYGLSTSDLYKCLKEGERVLHIGPCFSKIRFERGEICVK